MSLPEQLKLEKIRELFRHAGSLIDKKEIHVRSISSKYTKNILLLNRVNREKLC